LPIVPGFLSLLLSANAGNYCNIKLGMANPLLVLEGGRQSVIALLATIGSFIII
jgi:hypothetical protein